MDHQDWTGHLSINHTNNTETGQIIGGETIPPPPRMDHTQYTMPGPGGGANYHSRALSDLSYFDSRGIHGVDLSNAPPDPHGSFGFEYGSNPDSTRMHSQQAAQLSSYFHHKPDQARDHTYQDGPSELSHLRKLYEDLSNECKELHAELASTRSRLNQAESRLTEWEEKMSGLFPTVFPRSREQNDGRSFTFGNLPFETLLTAAGGEDILGRIGRLEGKVVSLVANRQRPAQLPLQAQAASAGLFDLRSMGARSDQWLNPPIQLSGAQTDTQRATNGSAEYGASGEQDHASSFVPTNAHSSMGTGMTSGRESRDGSQNFTPQVPCGPGRPIISDRLLPQIVFGEDGFTQPSLKAPLAPSDQAGVQPYDQWMESQ